MGDKITSKKLAERGGVNTIPGYTDVIARRRHAVEIANEIGYPVMLKATAGGGGKGMRVARNDEECRDGFERAANEARSSFGDDRMFIEKFIEEPRHIEIQVMADTHGNVIYLSERECSIQRRHQKVIEEAPSPFLDEATAQAMGEQAVALARAVGLPVRRHGRVHRRQRAQLLFPGDEHPPAGGAPGHRTDHRPGPGGADDPRGRRRKAAARPGRVGSTAGRSRPRLCRGPVPQLPAVHRPAGALPARREETTHVRVDTGVYEGGEVSMYYDPMIAKLITYGRTARRPSSDMRAALDRFLIRGVSSNISFLAALMAHPRFVAGRMSTNLIAEEYPDGFHPATCPTRTRPCSSPWRPP